MSGTDHCQLAVIGGGPGGYSAAFHAAEVGLDVQLISAEPGLGGVCLQRGCIPSKHLLEAAECRYRAQEMAERGLHFGEPEIDLEALRQHTDTVIDTLCDGLRVLSEQRRVQLRHGRARFLAPDRLQIDGDDGGELHFEHAIIATGSQPARPDGLPDDERIMDSAAALALDEIPARLAVLGGGFIGLELGTIYHALGSRVVLIEMRERLLPDIDEDLVAPLRARLDERFDRIRCKTALERVETGADGLYLRLGTGDELQVDRLLIAIGRRPRSDDLGLEHTAVICDQDGHIRVDHQGRSDDPRLFAVGDVCAAIPLAHNAIHQGRVAAETIAGMRGASRDFRAVPAVVYTDPQIATCGLSEQAALVQERPVQVHHQAWRTCGRAHALGATDGVSKLITDPDSGRLLGAGIVGRQAESLIGEAVVAVELGATLTDLHLTQHPHPTLCETLGEAASASVAVAIHG